MGQNPATKHTEEFRRETADYIISSGRPITECCKELGLNSKTVSTWVVKRRRELGGAGADHVGIVESCDGSTVHTIEGNTSDSCARRSYRVGSASILGYGTPLN